VLVFRDQLRRWIAKKPCIFDKIDFRPRRRHRVLEIETIDLSFFLFATDKLVTASLMISGSMKFHTW